MFVAARHAPLLFVVTFLGCSAGASHDTGEPSDASLRDGAAADSGADGGGIRFDVAGDAPPFDAAHGDGGARCVEGGLDVAGCVCATSGASRPCFPGDASNRNVGTCKDGTQTCTSAGESKTWGACTGAVVPQKEVCTDALDHDCNGLAGCKDPSCATDPACNTACKDGDVRDCYDGPAGTVGVGTCKAGTQKCVGGAWAAACDGEVLPTAEVCSDAKDHNCNHLAGCLDLFVCILDPACQEPCKKPLDPGCVCAEGSGDSALCPKGTHAVSGGPVAPNLECCPCTPSDCGIPNCCGETMCKGDPKCGSVTCGTLPASCGGKVSADCDDFPEDCDEPCCECYGSCATP